MKERLQHLLGHAQTPYYHFPVACVLECFDGTLFDGINVETSSPGSGSCAERVALYSALSHGYEKKDFKALYLMNTTEKFCYPCFICRQALNDYCLEDMKIISYNSLGEEMCVTLKELCPYPFNSEDLQ